MARKAPNHNPLAPSSTLLCKLGSIAVHADELLSPGGHEFDKVELATRLADPEVKAWIVEMTKLALLPVKRN